MSNTVATDLLPLPTPQTHHVGGHIQYLATTDSTNIRALEACADGHVFVAECQTAGRGRHGKQWHSIPHVGLWFSICLAAPLPGAGFAAALSVRDAVADTLPLSICWPNDLYAEQRKVCGILTEQRGNWLALGIGINVNHIREDFPTTLRHRAGSLAMATGHQWDRGRLLKTVLECLDPLVDRLRRGEHDTVRDEWVAACDIIGKHIRRGGISGQVAAVDDDGALLVSTRMGMQRVTSGDIVVLGV